MARRAVKSLAGGDLAPQVEKSITRKGVLPDLTSDLSTNTEMDICVQAQTGLNSEPTASMTKIQLWRDKTLFQFCDWL